MDAPVFVHLCVLCLHCRYDKDKSGWLSPDELTAMVAAIVPGTSQLDIDHFRSMLDIDGNQQVTQAEFVAGLDSNAKATAAVSVCMVTLAHSQLPRIICSCVCVFFYTF